MSVKEKLDAVVEQLGCIGIVPVIKLDKVENAEKLAKALREGGINCAEVTFRAKGADEVISRMVKAYPDMLVGAHGLDLRAGGCRLCRRRKVLRGARAQSQSRQALPR